MRPPPSGRGPQPRCGARRIKAAPNFVAVCRNANLPLNDLHRLAHMVSLFLPDGLSTASASATPAPPTTPGGGIITPRPAAPPPAPATTPTAAPAPPRMARHRPLRAPPVLLSVAHPRSPTSSTVAEPGPTPGRPPYPFWPPRPRRPGSPTPADEDPASCPLSASAGAAIPGSAAPTPYGGGMTHA